MRIMDSNTIERDTQKSNKISYFMHSLESSERTLTVYGKSEISLQVRAERRDLANVD